MADEAEKKPEEKKDGDDFWTNVLKGAAFGLGAGLVTMGLAHLLKKREDARAEEHYGTAFFLENGDVVVRPNDGVYVIEPDGGGDGQDDDEREDEEE